MKAKSKRKGNFPPLRFPEFTAEWERKKLGEVAEIVGGGTPDTNIDEYWDGNIQWFTPSEIKSNFVSKSIRTITELGLKKSSAKLLPIGAILLTTRATIGDVAIAEQECATNQGFQSLIVCKNVNNKFIANWIRINKNKFIKLAKGSTFAENSKKDIEKINIFITELPEQTKIASFLSLIDERIQTQMKIIEEWEKLKKGLQEQIFLQKLRFKDENEKVFVSWKEKKLGEIATITTGKLDANAMVKNGKFRFYTCAKEFFYINKYAFDTEALLISGNGANVGYIHHYKGKFNAYQRTYVLYSIEENILYLKYYLEQFLFQRILLEKRDGNTPYIVLSTLSEMNILFPCLKEQSNIANFLSSIDNKINLEKSLLSAYQEQKKYLLQNLFI